MTEFDIQALNTLLSAEWAKIQETGFGVFVFRHQGVYLPGFTAIVAESEEQARVMIGNVLPVLFPYIKPKDDWNIVLVGQIGARSRGVIKIWNGDY